MYYFKTLHSSPTYCKLSKFHSNSMRAKELHFPYSANKEKERAVMWFAQGHSISWWQMGWDDQSVTEGGTLHFIFQQTLDWIWALSFSEQVVGSNRGTVLIWGNGTGKKFQWRMDQKGGKKTTIDRWQVSQDSLWPVCSSTLFFRSLIFKYRLTFGE